MAERFPNPSPRRKVRAGLRAALTLLAWSLALSGCGSGSHDQSGDALCAAEPPEITEKRIAAYASTLRPLLAAKVCNTCHGGTGSSAPYLYLSADGGTAVGIASSLVNFEDIPASRFVKKMISGHNCGTGGECVAFSTEVSNQIKAWANIVSALPSYTCENGKRVVLTSVVMNSSQLSLTTDTTFRWDVGALFPDLGTVWFKINAKLVAAPTATALGAYQLSSPMMAASESRVHVKDLRVIIESLASVNAINFVGIDFILDLVAFTPANTWNVPKLSNSKQLVSFNNGQNLGFSFLIEKTDADATAVDDGYQCRVPELFQTVIDVVYKGTSAVALETGFKCLRCHDGTNTAAFSAFPQAGPGVDGCLEAMLRVDFATASNSLLLQKPERNITGVVYPAYPNNHPVLETLTGPQRTAITNWIAAEKAAGGY